MDYNQFEILDQIIALRPVIWSNANKENSDMALKKIELRYDDIIKANQRLDRFAPLIRKLFPETENGIIESPLIDISKMKNEINRVYKKSFLGKWYLKCDSHLKVAGSIKARGGIYEVLKHAEELVLKNEMMKVSDDYSKMAGREFKDFFSRYKIAVGSTGNLGLSIGIISSALGFDVTVHMSRDAKQWKKDLLKKKGAKVIEYSDDYSKAVEEGRKQCENDSMAYFIDDENSRDLFLGYSVAALRLKEQLLEEGIVIDKKHQMYVYLPCGVGGAPGGITFGLKHIFGDNVHCYFVEPTHSPCMLLGLYTGKKSLIHVRDYGIDNITEADGLAVGAPSKLVSDVAEKLLSGIYTIEDEDLFKLLALLKDTYDLKIEPSAAASLMGPSLIKADENSVHISWATGGLFVPDYLYNEMYERGRKRI